MDELGESPEQTKDTIIDRDSARQLPFPSGAIHCVENGPRGTHFSLSHISMEDGLVS